ncbi:hypothetical protein JW948_04535 [bacterium]|nr:hypothetical protein [bacterium]
MVEEQMVKVVFKGEVLIGKDVQQVKNQLAQKFKLDAAAVQKLFSGKPVTIKKNIPRVKALKYRDAFLEAGAKCYIEWMDPEYFHKMMLPSEGESQIITCPQCGLKQEKNDNCESCGYDLRPGLDKNILRLAYDAAREKGVPKWVIWAVAGFFLGIVITLFIPKASKEIPALYTRQINRFPQAADPGGLIPIQWNFARQQSITYNFERKYSSGNQIDVVDPSTGQTQDLATNPLGTRGTAVGMMTIQSHGDHSADIQLRHCLEWTKFASGALNYFLPDDAVVLPDVDFQNLQENGQILAPVSSDYIYMQLLFRLPASIHRSGESESIEVEVDFKGNPLKGTIDIALERFVMIDGHVCAKLVHQIDVNSIAPNEAREFYEFVGTFTGYFDIEEGLLIIGHLQQNVIKNIYEDLDGFFAWVGDSRNESIIYMKKGLVYKLDTLD